MLPPEEFQKLPEAERQRLEGEMEAMQEELQKRDTLLQQLQQRMETFVRDMKAEIADQLVHRSVQIAVVNRVPAQRGFHFAYQMFTGKLKTGKDYTCTTIEDGIIKTPFPVAYHIDGEAGGFASEFKIEVNPHSLRLMVPAASIGKI